MRPAFARSALVFATFLAAAGFALAATERVFRIEDRPPLQVISIGELTDPKGKGKKFVGEGEVALEDGRRIAVEVTLKHNAKKLKNTYKLKTPKKQSPKIGISIKTVGDPEVITLLKFAMKDEDKQKYKVKEKDKEGVPVVELVTRDPDLSDQLTLDGVRLLLRKDDDFAGAIGKFDDSIAADYENPNPTVFRALAVFLEFLRDTSMESGGTVLDLTSRAEYGNSGGTSFWTLNFEEQSFEGQGDVPDAVPTADEAAGFLRDELVPAIEQLLAATETTSADFEYRMNFVDAEGDFFDGDAADDKETVWVDYGDVQLLRAFLQLSLGWLDFLHAYELDDVDPNDFDAVDHPGVDCLDVFETNYADAGKLTRPAMLTSSRQHLEDAFASYKAAAAFILAESTEQRANGLATPYRQTFRGDALFSDSAERTQFVSNEAAFRTWAQDIVDQFDDDAGHTITKRPDGTTIEVGKRPTINFYEFWQGIDIRRLYFKTVENPVSGRLVLGFSDIDDITAAQYTADGALVKFNDVEPGPFDLLAGKSPMMSLRVSNVPSDAKTVDGDLSDWDFGADSVQIMGSPRIPYDTPRPDFGEVWASRDSGNLYLAIAVDPDNLEDAEIEMISVHGEAFAGSDGVYGPVSDPVLAAGAAGVEIAVPLSNFPTDEWVKIWLKATSIEPWGKVYAGRIFVKVR